MTQKNVIAGTGLTGEAIEQLEAKGYRVTQMGRCETHKIGYRVDDHKSCPVCELAADAARYRKLRQIAEFELGGYTEPDEFGEATESRWHVSTPALFTAPSQMQPADLDVALDRLTDGEIQEHFRELEAYDEWGAQQEDAE